MMWKRSDMSIFLFILTMLITNTVCVINNNTCNSNEFHCSTGGCINRTQHCDGNKDCGDGTDEINCDFVKCMSPEYFKCPNNKCISIDFVCDKENDCLDWSDEFHCHDKSLTRPCTEGEFQCSDGTCIPNYWHCDKSVDCDDGSDEDVEKCREKTSCTNGFLCSNLHCISKMWRCNGKDDCGDGSDETHCDFNLIDPEKCLIEDRKFLCHDHKKCISVEHVCNNNTDCLDASDEGGLCNNVTGYKKECNAIHCSGIHECLRKPHGVMCVCPNGKRSVNNTCFDINKCEEYGICDQHCLNLLHGKYACSCDPDYELVDNHRCKIKGDNPVLAYSSLRQIRTLNLVTHNSHILIDNLQQATGLAVDEVNIYWTIIHEGIQGIVKANKNDTTPNIIVTSGLGTPENLAIDSITHNLYFTDAKMKHIGVCDNNGLVCTVLHNKNIDKPRAIAVSPMDGLMYWTDWGESPMIARSGMDGSLSKKFITENVHWPNGVHVDYCGKRIYWVDAKLKIIESVKLDASDRRVILTQSVDHPFSITIFEDKLFWSDWSGREIKVCNKFTGKNQKSLIRERKNKIYGMQIFHPSLFKSQTFNPCQKSKCSHICLLAPKKNENYNGYTCACPDDKQLSPEGWFCSDLAVSHTLILGTPRSILKLEVKHLGRQKVNEIPLINKISRISAVAYNSLSGTIIIYDSKLKKLFMYDLVGMTLLDLAIPEIGSLYSLKFDNHGNNLYWCDLSRKTLEVLSLSTNIRITILNEIDGYIPIAVALVPDQGYMFVAMKDNSRIHIDRIEMNGNIRSLVHIVEFGLMEDEIVLHFDMDTRRLYFTDNKNNEINSVSEDGLDRKLIKNSGFVKDMVTIDNEIFWVSEGLNILNWVDKNTNERFHTNIGNVNSDSILSLTVANVINKNIQHPCQQNNGDCSHVCLLSGKNKVCSCPIGLVLSVNGLECLPPKPCKSDEYRCLTGECISTRFRCDSKEDCPQGDDEDAVKCLHYMPNLCPKSQFLCHNKTKCIDKKLLCNNVKDCSDGSDEKECGPKHTCDPLTEFECPTGECIQVSFLCDGNLDCMDGQDELNCQNHTCHHMEFRCKSGTCIAATWECDGEIDCIDGSDEHDTCNTKKCKIDQFTCSNGRCISNEFTCNSENDCDDNSDEYGCIPFHSYLKKPIKICNEETEFECENIHGHCIPIEARCNSTSECKHFEDELNCGCQKTDFFECNNKRCIPKDWLCDKTDDCGDQSDESPKACNMTFQHSSTSIVSAQDCDGYLCKNKECIPLDQVCDKHMNCKDGSDEEGLCGLSCQFMNCSHICQETPKGGKCVCYHGYKIAYHDGKTCEDINECENNNLCAQYCTNLDGSYSCNCLNSDYMLRADKSSCKALGPPMELVYSEVDKIRSISGDFKESKLLFSNPGVQISGFDIDIRRNLIYWTSEEAGTLICMDMQQDRKVYMKDLISPSLIRIDWLTKNIYFIENHSDIVVCNLNAKRCATIYKANVHSRIKAFSIDPLSGVMFWAESIWAIWSSPTTIIRRSDCSGHNVKTIIDEDLHDVIDLTVDPIKHMVYWVDMVNSTIERANYNGSDRSLLISSHQLPKKISLYEDKLYWTNDVTGYSIFKCKVFAVKDVQCESIPVEVFTPIDIFMISQQSKQINASNICNHVHCDFICASGSKGPMCVCEDGSQVEPGSICEDAGLRKSPTFKVTDKNGSRISMFVVFFIIIIFGLLLFYYYIYHYKKKPLKAPLRFHFKNPVSNTKKKIIQPEQLEPECHAYENPFNEGELINSHVPSAPYRAFVNYNDERCIYESHPGSQNTSSLVTEYEEDQRKKLLVL